MPRRRRKLLRCERSGRAGAGHPQYSSSKYLDSLIGPYPDGKKRTSERSPLSHAHQVSVPIIFFQGDEDKIVPPDQTERMVAALRARGIPVGYLLFSGEQHGFRKAENIKRA